MRLSIIIPVYNVEPWLDDCLASVRRQSFEDWECICVDDGSTDGSGRILDEYASKDQRFKVIHQENRGVGAARNSAIDVARGVWLGFVDGDDQISESWLEVFAGVANEYPEAEIVTMPDGIVEVSDGCRGLDGEKTCKGISIGEARGRIRNDGKCKVWELKGKKAREWGCRHYSRNGWATLNFVRRAFMRDTRFVEGLRIKEDLILFLELSRRVNDIAICNAKGYFYTQRRESALGCCRDEDDCIALLDCLRRFPSQMRQHVSRVAAGDVMQWVNEKDSSLGYAHHGCKLLDCWRSMVEDGLIDVADISWWWRPAFRHWLRSGDFSWIARTRKVICLVFNLGVGRVVGLVRGVM